MNEKIETTAPDARCVTLPNGDCVATKPCMHSQPNAETLLHELAHFTGDLQRYRHWTKRLIYTPGIQHLAERAGAYWLIGLVASWQMAPAVAKETFQIWKLVVRPDRTATATATGDDQSVLTSQDIAYTDFPLADITVWLIDGTLLLPSEY